MLAFKFLHTWPCFHAWGSCACASAFPAGTLCQAIWPFFNIYSLAASSVFSIPFWRHFIAWLGSVEATPANFKRILKRGSVAVIVGGIAEMYMQVCVCDLPAVSGWWFGACSRVLAWFLPR